MLKYHLAYDEPKAVCPSPQTMDSIQYWAGGWDFEAPNDEEAIRRSQTFLREGSIALSESKTPALRRGLNLYRIVAFSEELSRHPADPNWDPEAEGKSADAGLKGHLDSFESVFDTRSAN